MAKYYIAIVYENYEPDSKIPDECQQALNVVRELSTNELRKLRRYIRKIVSYNEHRHLFMALSLNLEDFQNTCHEYLANYHETQTMNWDITEQMSLNLGRLFLNILSMFRCFLDHSKTAVARKFVKNSKEVKRWENATHKCYDESFAYRLLYELRNYGQHIGMPPINLHIFSEANENLIGKETITSNFHIELQTEPLLKDKKIFKKLGNEISLYKQSIDLMPILEEWFVQMRDLFETRQKIEIRSVKNAAKEIVNLRNNVSVPEQAQMCILVTSIRDANDKLKLKMEWLPELQAQSILGHTGLVSLATE